MPRRLPDTFGRIGGMHHIKIAAQQRQIVAGKRNQDQQRWAHETAVRNGLGKRYNLPLLSMASYRIMPSLQMLLLFLAADMPPKLPPGPAMALPLTRGMPQGFRTPWFSVLGRAEGHTSDP